MKLSRDSAVFLSNNNRLSLFATFETVEIHSKPQNLKELLRGWKYLRCDLFADHEKFSARFTLCVTKYFVCFRLVGVKRIRLVRGAFFSPPLRAFQLPTRDQLTTRSLIVAPPLFIDLTILFLFEKR